MIARREFIMLLGSAAAAWSAAARAQQPGKLPTIGILAGGTPSSHGQLVAALVQRLRELGWTEGHTVAIEVRWAEGRLDRFAEIGREFARVKVSVIVTSGLAVPAVRQETSLIPIVFAGASEPVAIGLVASLARPGDNITGLSLQQTDYAGKRFELFREMVPELRRLAILGSVSARGAMLEMNEVQATARALGLEVLTSEIRRAEDIAPAFRMLAGHADALYVCPDALITTNSIRINTLAAGARLPTTYIFREDVAAGGLMSYGPSFPHIYRRAADLVDKVLRGAKPGDIPIEQPTKFNLVVNLITAQALGLTVPPALLARADEVIE
jgi:putative tryptophan/tyrosine transport system substrate-binding protein